MQNKIPMDPEANEQVSEQPHMFLNKKELYELTDRKRVDAQIKELHKLEITFRLRGNGTIAVLREHVQREFGGKIETTKKVVPFKLNWDGLNA